MIDKDWRRRFSTLSERLGGTTPALECERALGAFNDIQNPKPVELSFHEEHEHVRQQEVNYDKLVDSLTDKALDAGIWASILLKK